VSTWKPRRICFPGACASVVCLAGPPAAFCGCEGHRRKGGPWNKIWRTHIGLREPPQEDKVSLSPEERVEGFSPPGRGDVIVKDYSGAPFPSAATFSEGGSPFPGEACRPSRKLRGIGAGPGLNYAGRLPRRDSISSGTRAGLLDKMRSGELSESCFKNLVSLIQDIHERGVAHGDLHQKKHPGRSTESPAVIDFSTAYVEGRSAVLGWVDSQRYDPA